MGGSRFLSVMVSMAFVVGACASDEESASTDLKVDGTPAVSDAGQGATTSADVPTTIAATATVATVALEFDDDLVAEYVADGFDVVQAMFLAGTEVEVTALARDQLRVVERFPTGDVNEMTISFQTDVTGDPSTVPTVVTHLVTADRWEFTLDYFVAGDSIPDDVEALLRDVQTAVGFRRAARVESDGVIVTVKAIVKQGGGDAAKQFIKAVEGRVGLESAQLSTLYKGVKAGLTVKDALALQTEHAAFDAELDKLEDCANNPTNKGTQNLYKEDPGAKQRILDDIASARSEIRANTAVSFVGMLTKVGSGVVKAAPWLAYLVGPGTSWSKDVLQKINQELVDQIRKEVTPCEEALAFEFSGSETGGESAGNPVQVTWHVWGLLCEGDEQWRVWEKYEDDWIEIDNGPPGENPSWPVLITFGEDGAMTSSSWVIEGRDYLAGFAPRTAGGITFTLSPPDRPTQLNAVVPIWNAPSLPLTVPLEAPNAGRWPHGTFPPCEPAG